MEILFDSGLSKKVINDVDTAGKSKQLNVKYLIEAPCRFTETSSQNCCLLKGFNVLSHLSVIYTQRLETGDTVEIMREEDLCFLAAREKPHFS